MFHKRFFLIYTTLMLCASQATADNTQIPLFNASGNPVAYIDGRNDMTIYLWSGEPVAYLDLSNNMSIYGFNGKHIGWYINGIIRDHDGNGSCANRDSISMPGLEGIKGIQRISPIRRIQEIEPIQPILTMSWSPIPCDLLLISGAS